MDLNRQRYILSRDLYAGQITLVSGRPVMVKFSDAMTEDLRTGSVYLKGALEYIAARVCEMYLCTSVTIRYEASPVNETTNWYGTKSKQIRFP